MNLRSTILLVLFLITSSLLFCQVKFGEINADDLHYGVATKLSIEIIDYKSGFEPNFKLSVAGGVGYDLGVDNFNFFPSFHAGIIIFNSRAIGGNLKDRQFRMRNNFFMSGLGTLKLDKRDFTYNERFLPFYHFADFTANPLQNPYKSSFTLGVVQILATENLDQRIGFFNANLGGRVQVSYYNDGGPVLKWFGDKRDRYYTGGFLFSYHADSNAYINLVELGYHKFTGYVANAFDLGEQLQIDFQTYKDTNQIGFNQQRWKLNVMNIRSGVSMNLALYDRNNLDFQDMLHFRTNVPYHPDYFPGWRWSFGGKHEYINTNF